MSAVEIDGQYRVLREEAGFVERPERRLLRCAGPDAVEYVHDQVTNDVVGLAPGEGSYAALLDRKGRMQTDLRVLRTAPDELLLDCDAEGREALGLHLGTYRVGRDVEFTKLDDEFAVVSVIGPATARVLGGPIGPEHSHRELNLAGTVVRAVATDTGADLICPRPALDAVRAALREGGAESVQPEAVEVIRVESGRPRFGREMTTATIPQEAGINDRAVSFTKGCYIGQETVARLHYKGKPNRHLRGLRLEAPVARGAVVRLGDRELGNVGTAVLSPALGPIALAVLRREAEPGARVLVDDEIAAEVVELPFNGSG